MSRALFLDRDGTIIVHRPYLHDPSEVELLPGVREAIRYARGAGFSLFLFTNQSGVGRGWFKLEDVEKVNERMIELLGFGSDIFTEVCVAPERPDEPAVYRKPSPRFILEMLAKHGFLASETWMIGDSPTDWQAGINAGVNSAAIITDSAAEEIDLRRQYPSVSTFPSLGRFIKANCMHRVL